MRGATPFSNPIQVRAVARLYDDYVHLVVLADSPIHHLADLRGRRVSIGADGAGIQLTAERLLGVAGVSRTSIVPATMDLAESASALQAGDIDAFFWSGGLPTDGVTKLADELPIRLVDLRSEAALMREEYGSVYRIANIPEGTYSGVTAVTTVAVPNLLVTLPGTDERFVEDFTSEIFASVQTAGEVLPVALQLNSGLAIYTEPIPLHAGAEAYFRSRKPGL
jgi:TRAP transporter TAXI family solute receptor